MVSLPHWPQIPIWQEQKQQDYFQQTKLLAKHLGNPQQKLPPTIHIAGTNGKGSCTAMLKSIFATGGYTVHTYTSPHLLEFNERINIAGENISDYHLYELLEEVRMKAEKLELNPGFFGAITIAAFLAFSRNQADLLILETGLGGRLDATNIIEKPLLTMITPISLDHMEHLGNNILSIAEEKAGIIKNEVPCVISAQANEVYQLLFTKCTEQNSSAFCYEYDYIIEDQKAQNNTLFGNLLYRSQKYSLKLPYPSLPGEHQYINASSVVAAVMLVNEMFKISSTDIAAGLENTVWPGRIEKISAEKYEHLVKGDIDIYLDGAHNSSGAMALANWIKNTLQSPVYLIIGITRNRDIESFAQHFHELIKEGRAVKILSEASSYHPEVISKAFNKHGFLFDASESLEEAIRELSNVAAIHEKATIIITGSLFIVSDFYRLANSCIKN